MHIDLPPRLPLLPKPAIIRPAEPGPAQASVLPGWFPAGAAAAAAIAGLTSVALHASAGNASASLTAPATIQAGDLLFFFDGARGAFSIPAPVVPAGFTQINNHSITGLVGLRVITSYKIAAGSDAGAGITGMDGAVFNEKGLLVFRGNVPIASVTVGDPEGIGTSGDPAPQTVSAASGVAPLIVLATYVAGNAVVDTRTMTPAKDGEYDGGVGGATWTAWKIYNSAPADVVVDMTDEDVNVLQSCYLQLS
jgi:hypothetical protein